MKNMPRSKIMTKDARCRSATSPCSLLPVSLPRATPEIHPDPGNEVCRYSPQRFCPGRRSTEQSVPGSVSKMVLRASPAYSAVADGKRVRLPVRPYNVHGTRCRPAVGNLPLQGGHFNRQDRNALAESTELLWNPQKVHAKKAIKKTAHRQKRKTKS